MDNLPNKFGSKLHRLIVGIPIGTCSATLIGNCFYFNERSFSLTFIKSSNSSSRCIDTLLKNGNHYIE